MTCTWPFHGDPDCNECKDWVRKRQENLDQYLKDLHERRVRTGKKGRSASNSAGKKDTAG